MRRDSLLGLSASGFHRLVYYDWGTIDAPRTAVCVHGLTRNGRDFDGLAAALVEKGYRVACPDVVGRGQSDWLADPAGYGYPQMLSDAAALLARLGADRVDWVGTSMGGLIGMMLAAQPKTPLRRLVINDVGPFIPKAALVRIADYLGQAPRFADFAEAEAYLRRTHAPFGRLSDAQWSHLTEHSICPAEEGGFRLRYDSAIAKAFEGEVADVELWDLWEAIEIPLLVLRGAESDLLLPDTARRMADKAEVIEVAGCGHAPALMDPDQIAIVADWLQG